MSAPGKMEELPAELLQEFLLATRPRDVLAFCSTNRTLYELCSSPYLWREKFRREGIPLLEVGKDFHQWLKIYTRSLRAMEKTDEMFYPLSPDKVIFSYRLTGEDDPYVLVVGGVNPLVVSENEEEALKTRKSIQMTVTRRRSVFRLVHPPYPPDLVEEIISQVVVEGEKNIPTLEVRMENGGPVYLIRSEGRLYSQPITLEQAYLLTFRLVYFGLIGCNRRTQYPEFP